MTTEEAASLLSYGLVGIMLGKFINGFLVDWAGGRTAIMVGFSAQAVAMAAFATSRGLGMLTLCYIVCQDCPSISPRVYCAHPPRGTAVYKLMHLAVGDAPTLRRAITFSWFCSIPSHASQYSC